MRSSIWDLDPGVVFLNHGSFGAVPRPVRDRQQALRDRMERQPVQFLTRDLEAMRDTAREAMARFVGADVAGVVFVPNATTGVATVVGSLDLRPGDEIVVTDHGYNAVRNQVDEAAGRSGAIVRVASFPFATTPEKVVAAVVAAVGERTRLVIVDHATSPTALVLPVAEITAELEPRGVPVLVDGAHGPGMVPVDVAAIGASYYTGNGHKWMCAPRGAAFLWTRPDRRDGLRPTVISHGWNTPRPDRSRYHLLFDWIGTTDPTAPLCLPAAIDAIAGLAPGGWAAHRDANRDLALQGRDLVAGAVGAGPLPPAEMIGSMATIPLGRSPDPAPPPFADPLNLRLLQGYGIEVPVVTWPAPPHRMLRISAQAYNTIDDYERLAEALVAEGISAA